MKPAKANSFKRDDQSFKDLAERPKSETKVNEPSPPVKETDISNLLETHKTPAVSAIEKHLKELGSKATPDSSRQESPRHGERTPDKEQNQSRENVQKTPAVSAIEKGMEEQLKNPADASMKKEKEPTKDKTKEKDINPDR